MVTIVRADEDTAHRLSASQAASIPDTMDMIAMTAVENEKIVGFVLYKVEGALVILLDAQAEDMVLLDGLVRAALSDALMMGVKDASSKNPALFPVLERLGFKLCDKAVQAVITDVLTGSCHGHGR